MSVEVKTAEAVEREVAAPDCPECETTLAGDYCHRCGEKRPEARDLSLRHFFSEAVQELTSVEHSKIVNTLRALLFRPGLLTREWVLGRRRRYLKPLNLCLALIALNFFVYSFYKPVSMFDIERIIRESKREDTVRVFERFAAKKNLSVPEVFERVGDRWQRYMSLSAPLFVFGFAVVLQVVFFFRQRFFVEHLVFSMHFVAFSMLVVILLWPLYYFVGIKSSGVNIWIALGKWGFDIAYIFFAVRTVYNLGVLKSIPASFVLVVGYFLSYIFVFLSALVAAIVAVALS